MGMTHKDFVGKHSSLTLRTFQRTLAREEVDPNSIRVLAQRLNTTEMDLIDPHGTRFLDWDEIRQNSLGQLPLLLPEQLADRIGRSLNWDDIYINLLLHKRQSLPSYPSITEANQGSQFYELNPEEGEMLTANDLVQQFLDLEKAELTTSKRAVLIGPTGSGKTTLLHAFVRLGLNHPAVTIIYVPFSRVQSQSFENYLREKWLEQILKRSEGGVSEQEKAALVGRFQEQQVILLLDGENGIADAPTMLQLLQEKLKGWVGLAHIIFACRPNVWNIEQNPLSGGFEVYSLSPLNYGGIGRSDQVRQLIEAIFGYNSALGSQLRSKLEHPDQSTLRDFARNPQTLTILCYVWERWKSLPPTLNQLYASFVRLICGYEGTPVDTIDFTHEPLLQIAGVLARHAIESSSPFRLPIHFIHQVFRVEGWSWDIFPRLSRTLLYLVGTADEEPDTEVYTFLHPIGQILLAAGIVESDNYFLSQSSTSKLLESDCIFDPRLLDMYLLWLGRRDLGQQYKRSLLQHLINFDCGIEFYRYRAVFLAAAGLAELYDPDLAQQVVQQLREWLYSGTALIRYSALLALHCSQTSEAISVIANFVAANLNDVLSLQAIPRLGLVKNQLKNQAEEALNHLSEIDDLTIRFLVNESLIRLNPNEHQRLVRQVDLLTLTPTPFLSQVYARLFHPIDPEFTALYDGLYLPGTPSFQAEASLRLWRSIGRENSIALDRLCEHVSSGSPEFVIQNAAIGIGELGSGQFREVCALLQVIDTSENEQTERIAIASLAKFGIDFPKMMDALLEEGIETLEIDQVAALALAQITTANRLQPVEDQVNLEHGERYLYFESMIYSWQQNPYNFVQRYEIRQFLNRVGSGDPVLIDICLGQLISNSDPTLRWLGVSLLGEIGIGTDLEIQSLEQFLRSEEFKPARRAAAKSLSQLLAKIPNPIQKLEESLDRSQEDEMKLWLAYQLGVSIPQARPKALEHLIGLITNSSSRESEFIGSDQVHHVSVVQQASRQLTQLLTKETAVAVVALLHPHLKDELRDADPIRYRTIFDMVWRCACMLTPTQFSQFE